MLLVSRNVNWLIGNDVFLAKLFRIASEVFRLAASYLIRPMDEYTGYHLVWLYSTHLFLLGFNVSPVGMWECKSGGGRNVGTVKYQTSCIEWGKPLIAAEHARGGSIVDLIKWRCRRVARYPLNTWLWCKTGVKWIASAQVLLGL
jgi:hypothetical protein